MKILHKILFSVGVLFSCVLQAQQDAHFTNYTYNTMIINPAYVGSTLNPSLTFLGRTQWVGLEGAPDSQVLSYDTGINWRGLGLGFNILNDNIGPSNEMLFDANLSYGIPVSKTGTLAFGLKGGVRYLSVDWSKTNPLNKDDSSAINVNTYFPAVGFGGYYYTNRFYLGVSAPNIINSEHFDENITTESVSAERSHFFAMIGYVYDATNDLKLKPSTIVKVVEGVPVSLDVSLNLLYQNRFHGGVSWRWDDAISLLLGIDLTRSLMIGYSYDLTISEIQNYNIGSHEILLKYQLRRPVKIASPRFF